jgi:two-component system response regulator NreC
LNKKWPKEPPRRTTEMTMEIRILVADNHRIVREAICSRLSREPGLDIVGEAEDGRIAIQLARELNPDLIIMETSMPNLNGIEATRQIINELPDVKVIALSAHWDRRSVCEMLKAGASGYLPKRCAFQELVSAIQNVVSNRTYLSSHISGLVVDEYLHRTVEQGKSAYSILTDREREVLQLIAEGKSRKRIARELFVSPKTIEWHRSQLMKKLRIESVAELVKYAISEGLTSVAYA